MTEKSTKQDYNFMLAAVQKPLLFYGVSDGTLQLWTFMTAYRLFTRDTPARALKRG